MEKLYKLQKLQDGCVYEYNKEVGCFLASGGTVFTAYGAVVEARHDNGGFAKIVGRTVTNEPQGSSAMTLAFGKALRHEVFVGSGERVARWPRPRHRAPGRRIDMSTGREVK